MQRSPIAVRVLFGVSLLAAWSATASFAAPVDPSRDVEALLAAGEFGAAADLAASADGPLRDQLQQQVARARLSAGSAESLSPRGSSGRATGPSLQGGGANFSMIMSLIQRETDGEWEDVDGQGGSMTPFLSGVHVDPAGLLSRHVVRQEESGRLANLEERIRTAALNDDMARPSELRLVSLTRLEREVSRRLAAGQSVVESMKQLAGLSQIQYVFVYPEEQEIVLGGPAEGWRYNANGQAVGVRSGQPTLQLDDLVTVLRTFDAGGAGVLGCSIDPRQENLQALKEFVAKSQSRGPLSPASVRSWANRIGQILGEQNVTVIGVPAESRVARVLVEADYNMKLIGIGKLDGGSQIPNYFELLAKDPSLASGSLDALRWWMTMKYEAVLHSPEHTAFEIRGSAVQCQSENQFLADNGQRLPTGKSEPVNQQFAARFSAHYPELARRELVFADMQGIFDLALVAALIQREQLDQRAHWDRGAFDVNGAYQTAVYSAPRHTDSVVNHRVYHGKDVVLQVAGGVRGDVASVLADASLRQESPRLDGVAGSAREKMPENRWWWDAR